MALSGHFFDMYRLIAAVVCISMLVSGVAYAAEVDSITTRRVALDNSLQAINRIFEQRIKEGIREANEEQAYLLDTNAHIGLRDSRRIRGIATVT
jgi:CHASE1-domain containing sensor protein